MKKEKKEDKKSNKKEKENKEDKVILEKNKEIELLKKQLEEAIKGKAEGEEKGLRALAELENFKKRKQQEVDAFKKYAAENVVKEILPILDSFDLACSHALESAKETDQNIIQGFVLIQKQLNMALERINVKPIDALNKPFDHNR